jgi:hypothetical protein
MKRELADKCLHGVGLAEPGRKASSLSSAYATRNKNYRTTSYFGLPWVPTIR